MTRYRVLYRYKRFREASLVYSRQSYLDSTKDGSNKLRRNIVAYIPHTQGVMFRKPGVFNRAQTLSHSCKRNFSAAIYGAFLGEPAIKICKIRPSKLSLNPRVHLTTQEGLRGFV